MPIAIGRPNQKSYSPHKTTKIALMPANCKKNKSFLSNQEL